MSQSVPSRGYGITKADLAASRLVFVTLKDSVPKRKVAVPVPDGYTWEQFTEQVQSKLRLKSVGSICLASTDEKITSLDGIDDIDELYVNEGSTFSEAGDPSPFLKNERAGIHTTSTPSTRIQRQASGTGDILPSQVTIDDGDLSDDDEGKYSKRSTLLKRMAQRIFPDAFMPQLPITKSAGNDDKGSKKRKRRKRLDFKTLLLMCAVAGSLTTMLVIYYRT